MIFLLCSLIGTRLPKPEVLKLGRRQSLAPVRRARPAPARSCARARDRDARPPPNAELAARLRWTEAWFVRLFAREVGIAPHRYAAELRLRGAAGRLRYTDDPIDQIARDFAWVSQVTFTRAFSDRHGEPPARFSRRVRAEQAAADPAGAAAVRLEVFRPQPLFARRYPGLRLGGAAQWSDLLSRLPPDFLGCARMGSVQDASGRSRAPHRRFRSRCAGATLRARKGSRPRPWRRCRPTRRRARPRAQSPARPAQVGARRWGARTQRSRNGLLVARSRADRLRVGIWWAPSPTRLFRTEAISAIVTKGPVPM